MPNCLKCGTALAVNEEGVAPVLCDRCAGVATGRARRSMAMGSLGRLSERLFGKWQTFAIYMITGVGGALLSVAYDHQRSELGASGAIFGLVGAVLAGVKFGNLDISAGEKKAIFSSVVFFAIFN